MFRVRLPLRAAEDEPVTESLASTRPCRRAAPAASSATRPAAGGCICAAARSAATSAAATRRRCSTRARTPRATGHRSCRVSSRARAGSGTTSSRTTTTARELADPQHHPVDQPVPGPAGPGARRLATPRPLTCPTWLTAPRRGARSALGGDQASAARRRDRPGQLRDRLAADRRRAGRDVRRVRLVRAAAVRRVPGRTGDPARRLPRARRRRRRADRARHRSSRRPTGSRSSRWPWSRSPCCSPA